MPIKVFCIGAHKNATTSLEAALRRLGVKMCPGTMGYNYLQADLDQAEAAMCLTDIYDGFQDSPWNHLDFYQVLYEKHPDAFFILTSRPAEEWFESYSRFIQQGWEGWPSFPPKDLFIRLYGFPYIPENKASLMEKYDTRNRQIREFFAQKPETKFLDISISDLNYPILCTFLNVEEIPHQEIPHQEFPHSNRTK